MTTPNYGTDCRTFLDSGEGPDLDPFLTIIQNPTVVMSENLLRRFLMSPGTLPYAPREGMDLRNFVNKPNGNNFLTNINAQMKAQALRDQRVSAVSVQSQLLSGGVLNTTLQGRGAVGPFTIVLTVGQIGAGYTYL